MTAPLLVTPNQPLVYDPRFHTFESWAALMVEQYAGQNLEIPGPTTDWKLWGDGLKAIDIFSNEAIPSPETYENWFDWAAALLASINPRNL